MSKSQFLFIPLLKNSLRLNEIRAIQTVFMNTFTQNVTSVLGEDYSIRPDWAKVSFFIPDYAWA